MIAYTLPAASALRFAWAAATLDRAGGRAPARRERIRDIVVVIDHDLCSGVAVGGRPDVVGRPGCAANRPIEQADLIGHVGLDDRVYVAGGISLEVCLGRRGI